MQIQRSLLQPFFSLLLPFCALAGPELERFEYSARRMGIDVTITLYAAGEETGRKASQKAFERIREVEEIATDYDAQSELMRVSREASKAPMTVSPQLMQMLQACQDMSRLSDGAFDMTVGRYSLLWRQARYRKAIPDADLLKEASAYVGYRHVKLDESTRSIHITQPGLRLDLGGAAKGYALDRARDSLRASGCEHFLIRAGGEVLAGKAPPDAEAWHLKDGLSTNRWQIHSAAVATSGDTIQALEVGGSRYSHIIDPRTGYGLTNLCQAIVVAEDGLSADMQASTLCVLGPEEGLKLAKRRGWAARISTTDSDGRHRHVSTAAFRKRMQVAD